MGFDVKKVVLDGLEVAVFRSEDGVIVVDIATGGLAAKDTFGEKDGIPKIRIWINEQRLDVESDGSLKEAE